MASADETRTLKRFLGSLEAGDALSHLNLAVIPLSGDGHQPLDYTLGAEAIEANALEVTEVSEGGSVPELLVMSKADTMILLLDGEELVGAKQNRILTRLLSSSRSRPCSSGHGAADRERGASQCARTGWPVCRTH